MADQRTPALLMQEAKQYLEHFLAIYLSSSLEGHTSVIVYVCCAICFGEKSVVTFGVGNIVDHLAARAREQSDQRCESVV